MKLSKSLLSVILLFLCFGCISEEQTEPQLKKIGNNAIEPPNLTIAIGEQTVSAIIGSYTWKYYDEEVGGISQTEADALPPPELVDTLDVMTVHGDAEVVLLFDDAPNTYTIRVWDNEDVIATYETVELSAFEGIVIYEVKANWKQGSVSYAFVVNIE